VLPAQKWIYVVYRDVFWQVLPCKRIHFQKRWHSDSSVVFSPMLGDHLVPYPSIGVGWDVMIPRRGVVGYDLQMQNSPHSVDLKIIPGEAWPPRFDELLRCSRGFLLVSLGVLALLVRLVLVS
jgi:hypothetical protein